MLPLYLLSFFWPISFQPQEVADTLEVKRIGPQHQVGGKLPKIISHQSRFFYFTNGSLFTSMMCSFGQAGSDSLLTGRAFFAMTEIYFEVLDNRETALARLSDLILIRIHLRTSVRHKHTIHRTSVSLYFFRINNMNTLNPVLQYSFRIFSGWTGR